MWIIIVIVVLFLVFIGWLAATPDYDKINAEKAARERQERRIDARSRLEQSGIVDSILRQIDGQLSQVKETLIKNKKYKYVHFGGGFYYSHSNSGHVCYIVTNNTNNNSSFDDVIDRSCLSYKLDNVDMSYDAARELDIIVGEYVAKKLALPCAYDARLQAIEGVYENTFYVKPISI